MAPFFLRSLHYIAFSGVIGLGPSVIQPQYVADCFVNARRRAVISFFTLLYPPPFVSSWLPVLGLDELEASESLLRVLGP